ncbi:uncharacterized protein LOC125500309 isoform X2 [Athalia rosae]|uniref:uncharacterized protein LOC125500309 isoform X2 n=1 Tax=Athalia rosae TaxID=37344 RepID=UPI002033EB8C|nr:uncharacterized protein LOC125500309 isoform X2 [Athalia rosae]XP_048508680.1 uncharacterized protein LOC125500309 isoform X2 [Athalia rosae]
MGSLGLTRVKRNPCGLSRFWNSQISFALGLPFIWILWLAREVGPQTPIWAFLNFCPEEPPYNKSIKPLTRGIPISNSLAFLKPKCQ